MTAGFPAATCEKKNCGVATTPTTRACTSAPTGESSLGSSTRTGTVLPIDVWSARTVLAPRAISLLPSGLRPATIEAPNGLPGLNANALMSRFPIRTSGRVPNVTERAVPSAVMSVASFGIPSGVFPAKIAS